MISSGDENSGIIYCCLFVFFLPLFLFEKGDEGRQPFSANSLYSTPISEEKLLCTNPF